MPSFLTELKGTGPSAILFAITRLVGGKKYDDYPRAFSEKSWRRELNFRDSTTPYGHHEIWSHVTLCARATSRCFNQFQPVAHGTLQDFRRRCLWGCGLSGIRTFDMELLHHGMKLLAKYCIVAECPMVQPQPGVDRVEGLG